MNRNKNAKSSTTRTNPFAGKTAVESAFMLAAALGMVSEKGATALEDQVRSAEIVARLGRNFSTALAAFSQTCKEIMVEGIIDGAVKVPAEFAGDGPQVSDDLLARIGTDLDTVENRLAKVEQDIVEGEAGPFTTFGNITFAPEGLKLLADIGHQQAAKAADAPALNREQRRAAAKRPAKKAPAAKAAAGDTDY